MRSFFGAVDVHAPGAVSSEVSLPFRTHHPSSSATTSSSLAWPRHKKASIARTGSTWAQSNDSLATRYTDSIRPKNGSGVLLEPISNNTLFLSFNLSSPALSDDPRNHCCPVLGVLPDPQHSEIQYAVTPALTKYEDIKFKTIKDVVDFLQQVMQGLEFMHENYVAHRDCSSAHIALRAGSSPPEYYLTLSPASRQYRADGGRPRAMPFWGTDKSVPEFQRAPADAHDPFRADVYTLGHLVRRDFLEVYSNLAFLAPLVAEMMQEEPALRPTMDEAVDRLAAATMRLSDRAMAKPLRRKWRKRFPYLFREQESL